MADYKKRWGDRPDARLLREIDGMHLVMPFIYPNRADNEAFINERFDLTHTMEYIDKKNAESPEFEYKVFQLMVAAVMKTFILRPKLNYFICNKNMYEHDKTSCGFVIKKEFKDGAREGLAFVEATKESTLESIRDDIYRQIHRVRVDEAGEYHEVKRKAQSTDDFMDTFTHMPRFLVRFLFWIIRFLDRHGWIPAKLIAQDPDYSSVWISNLGSIGLHAGYHHLANWGSTSVFVIMGEIKKRPYYDDEGNITMKMSVDVGITIDERIADGYYYAKTVRLIKKLIENPELLEDKFETEVNIK